jgi:hypothetical protein
MANPVTSVDQVLSAAAQQVGGSSASELAAEMQRLTSQLRQLQTVSQSAAESTRTNTLAVQTASQASSSGSSSSGGSVAGTVLSVLGTGLGLSPLISGVARLFGGGGGNSAPPPLVKFALPDSVNVNAGVSSAFNGAFAVDAAQGNLPRPVVQPQAAAPQITVQVQAMDRRSFLDHSNDIALAVRQAMLESNVLNDVVREA